MNNALVNEDAERTLLGCAMLDPNALYQILPKLSADTFASQCHRVIYHAIAELAEAGKPVDELTISNALGAKGQLEAVGGVAYLGSLSDNVTSELARVTNVTHYADLLLDRSRRRQMRAAAQCLLDATLDASVSTADCAQSISDSLCRIEASSGKAGAARHVKEFMPQVLRELEVQSQNQGLVGMPTGLHSLDLATGGVREGELWTGGALPGKGKTSLALGFALANAEQGTPVLVFSLEMQNVEIGKRLLAAKSSITAAQIRNPQTIRRERWTDLPEAAVGIASLPIYVDDRPSMKISELLATARLFVRRHEVKLVVVDYVRLIEAPGRELRERVSYVANALRELAKSERVGVFMLSQLKRPENVNAKPTMIDLKESSDLEAHSHVVLLPYLPVGSDGSAIPDEQLLVIGKNRNGAIGSLPVHFDERRLQFFDRTEVSSAR